MKKRSILYLFILLHLIGFTFCEKDIGKESQDVPDRLPAVITDTVVIIKTPVEVQVGLRITDSGGSVITSKGVCWSTSLNPTINDNKVEVGGPNLAANHCNISGLEKGQTYYVRAFVTNSMGTAYGNEVSFTMPASFHPIDFNPDLTFGSIEDVDGNIYKTIQIGTQTWMAENLKTTKYSDGSPIFFGTGSPAGYTTWFTIGDGAYCWYKNDEETFKDAYGAIYNWHAVGTGNLCPIGWHVPVISEWDTLVTYLGGAVGSQDRSDYYPILWGGSNDRIYTSGFTPVPAGCLTGWGFGPACCWWTATKLDKDSLMATSWESYLVTFDFISTEVHSYGFSIRCLKDN